jgi:hypothetical protein
VVDLAATHGASETVRRKLDRLEAERAALEAELAAVPTAPAPIDWSALRRQAETLLGVEAAGPAEARAALRAYSAASAWSSMPTRSGATASRASWCCRGPERKEPPEIPWNLGRLIRW